MAVDRYLVQSVARTLHLIELVADGPPDGQSLTELARALGTSKSTALALARTAVSFGYLRVTIPGPRYALGTSLIRLGDIASRQIPVRALCRPLLEELSAATNLTSG
jgi:IclR family acetate operon transcriptional repressor